MLSGRLLHLTDPSPLDLEVDDLLIGISRICRWNGQTKGPVGFTVAQHSIVVERILGELVWPAAPTRVRLWALCHDLCEGIVGDLVPVIKQAIGPSFRELERRLEVALRIKLALPAELPTRWKAAVKKADIIAAVTEAVRLACWSEKDARREVGFRYRGPLWNGPLDPWPEAQAREEWRQAFRARGGAL